MSTSHTQTSILTIPFAPSMLKSPTSAQLGFGDLVVAIHVRPDNAGWSNGHLVDLHIPRAVERAVNKSREAGQRVVELSDESLQRVLKTPADDPRNVQILPVSWQRVTKVQAHWHDGMTIVTTHYDAVLFSEDHAIDPKYLAYFTKQYPGATFWAAYGGDSTIVVKLADKVVGVIAPVRNP